MSLFRSSPLAAWLLAACLLACALPPSFRRYLWRCTEYVLAERWWAYVGGYFYDVSQCDAHNLRQTVTIFIIPALLYFFILRHNRDLPFDDRKLGAVATTTTTTAPENTVSDDGDDGEDDDDDDDERGHSSIRCRNCCACRPCSRTCTLRLCPGRNGRVRCGGGRGCCGGRACLDRSVQVYTCISVVAMVLLAWWMWLTYLQGTCPPWQLHCGEEVGWLARGVMVSQAQISWWTDQVTLETILLVVMWFEGWRVRMSFQRCLLYSLICMFGQGIGNALAAALFVYNYRQMQRANDLCYWYVRTSTKTTKLTNVEGKEKEKEESRDNKEAPIRIGSAPLGFDDSAKAVAWQVAHEPFDAATGHVDLRVVSTLAQQHLTTGQLTPETFAHDLMLHPSPINDRWLPPFELWGMPLRWEWLLIAFYLYEAVRGTYVWMVWVVQFEWNSCWLWQHQDHLLENPFSFAIAASPFFTFVPLTLLELGLGHFWANAADRTLGIRHVAWVGALGAAAVSHWNNHNIAFVLAAFFGLRELHLRYGNRLLAMLNSAAAPHALYSDPFLPGQQSVWWSSRAPDFYLERVPAASMISSSGIAKEEEEEQAKQVRASPTTTATVTDEAGDADAASPFSTLRYRTSRQAVSPTDDGDTPLLLRSSIKGTSSSTVHHDWSLMHDLVYPLAVLLWSMCILNVLCEFARGLEYCGTSVRAWFGRLAARVQRACGWYPMPAPLHSQASLGCWNELAVCMLLYTRATSLLLSLSLWAINGNTHLLQRFFWLQNVAGPLAVWVAWHEARRQHAPAAVEQEAQPSQTTPPSTSSVRLLSNWVRMHPWVSLGLFCVQSIVLLLATPHIDGDPSDWQNGSYILLRTTITNLLHAIHNKATPQASFNAAWMMTLRAGLMLMVMVAAYVFRYGWSLCRRERGSPLSAWHTILLLAPLLFGLLHVWPAETTPCALRPGVESSQLTPEHLAAHRRVTEAIVSMRAHQQTAVRAAHPKHHGCVKATLTMADYVPSKYRYGLFARESKSGATSWPAYVRYSNGHFQTEKSAGDGDSGWASPSDSDGDIRGMAVKVILPPQDVTAADLALDADERIALHADTNTQDFVAITSDHFFAANVDQLDGLFEASTQRCPLRAISEWVVTWPGSLWTWEGFQQSFKRLNVLARVARLMFGMNAAGGRVLNPLSATYYSAVPYRMGPEPHESENRHTIASAVKFRFVPCASSSSPERKRPIKAGEAAGVAYNGVVRTINAIVRLLFHTQHDALPLLGNQDTTMHAQEQQTRYEQPNSFLRINMHRSLDPSSSSTTSKNNGGVCFHLQLQDQQDACQNPIEDASVSWRGAWTTVATLVVPRQLFLHPAALDVCERLAFNPWHSLKHHRPLGDINRIRKVAYAASADIRHQLNQHSPIGPVFTGHELPVVLVGDDDKLVINKNASSSSSVPLGQMALYDFADYPAPFAQLPRMVAEQPARESFSRFTHELIANNFLHSVRAQKYAQPLTRNEFTRLQHFEYVGFGRPGEVPYPNSNHLPSGRMRRPALVDEAVWTSDEFFARQFVRGINPLKLVRVTATTPLTRRLRPFDSNHRSHVASLLVNQQATTIDELAAQGRLLFADYPELVRVHTNPQHVLYAPVILFYTTLPSHDLLPLVIQLDNYNETSSSLPQQPALYFPSKWHPHLTTSVHPQSDGALLWMFAKMHAAHADAQWHSLVGHLLDTHLVLEPVIIATQRAFSTDSNNVVYALLKQHFGGTLAINAFGRMTLLAPVDPFIDTWQTVASVGAHELMATWFQSDSFIFMEPLPLQLRRRGFAVPSAADIAKHDFSAAEAQDHVRGFLYRDFGLALWYELRAYVVDVLATDARYLSSFHVDEELSAWFHQLFDDTDGARFSLRNRVHPGSDLDSLIDLLTQIIFTATAQHATVNFPQYDFLAFFPARPLGLTRPMPPAPAVPSEMYMLQALPDSDGIQLAQTTFDILSSCCADTLLDDPPVDAHGHTPHSGLLHGDDVTPRSFPAQWSALSRRLKQLETHERAHAEAQQFGDQYPYLYPSRIPMSTAQ